MQGQGGPRESGSDDNGPDGEGFDGREGVRGETRGFPAELQGGGGMSSASERERDEEARDEEAPDEEARDEEAARLAREAAEDEEFDAAVKAIVSSGLVAGPDPSVVADVVADDSQSGPPPDAVAEAERIALDGAVDAVYRSILTRAPEHKVQPSLERVRKALAVLGNPERAFRSIHITGTNGKTSTARMVEALLRERGLRTGRFTSPHLTSVRERMAIDGAAISREDFLAAWEDVEPVVELVDRKSTAAGGPRMSFFEVFTVMAYAAFANAPVDVAVVEVGMGGLWDATNVIEADVAVILPVAMDHERWLGHTIEEIAREKVGIVKPGSFVVSAGQEESVAQIVMDAARKAKARLVAEGPSLHLVSRETAVGGQLVTLQTPAARYEDVPLALKGEHQARNAAIALAAAEAFFGGGAFAADVVEHAFMSVSSPGRLEIVRSSPTVVADAAHNPHGAQATADALREYFPGRLVGVVAMMADKDVEGFLGVLEPVLDAVVVTDIASDRAMDADELADIAGGVFGDGRVFVERDLAEAIDRAAGLAESDDGVPMASPAVVVLGSIQLVAAARTLMGKPGADGA